MKKILTILLSLTCLCAWGGPVESGVWRKIKTTDGTIVAAELQGDEHLSFFRSADGRFFLPTTDGKYRITSAEELQTLALSAQEADDTPLTSSRQKVRRKASSSGKFTGTKKCLILLVQFADVKFADGHDAALYQRFANEEGFDYCETVEGTDYQFVGSVKDYFRDQSFGTFEIDFDVVGPLTVSKTRDYYGERLTSTSGTNYNDAHVGYCLYEALLLADQAGVDFSQYDWDSDGNVEQVYMLYAGQGQSDGGGDNTIWPTRSSLTNQISSETSKAKYVTGFVKADYSVPTLDGKKVDVFACSNELKSLKRTDGTVYATCIDGIGHFCHEFSHCMGLKDHYDTATSNGETYGTGYWDVMSRGLYNGNSMCPCGYNAYERWFCGWAEPTELTEPCLIDAIEPLSKSGQSYVIYCKGSDITGEYYLLENRQQTGWDTALPHHGLLITHVNYNSTTWGNNKVNDVVGQEGIALFCAGGVENRYYDFCAAYPWDPQLLLEKYPEYGSTPSEIIQHFTSEVGITFSANYNNALTTGTSPAATYFNGGNSKLSFADHDITDIEENGDDGLTMRFTYRNYEEAEPIDTVLLVRTHWGQGGVPNTSSIWKTAAEPADGYNMYCTFRAVNPNKTLRTLYAATYYSLTGSAATAMAQLINYHYTTRGHAPALGANLPETLASSTDAEPFYDYGYTTPGGSAYTLTTDSAGSVYPDAQYARGYQPDYAAIASGTATAIAHLMRACGLATQTEYLANQQTRSHFELIGEALTKVFQFDDGLQTISRTTLGDEAWETMLRSEIDAQRPVIAYAETADGVSHIFLIDGYSSDGRFHVNLGYNGEGDELYSLDAIPLPTALGTGTLSANMQAITAIEPASTLATLLGDANNDGEVSIADVTAVVNHILGRTPEAFAPLNADMNQDGVISIADVTAIVNLILGK
ncbi:MAG: M6 family metalloprotease domain-containing protein [Bacteroidaceae bacterium]|nr:M6 family metalloprotease domain-containing protein [Bacteroidaceae bacterium]